MRLTEKEKTFYEDTYQKLINNGVKLDENTCLKLVQRGINDKLACLKVIIIIMIQIIQYQII